MELEALGKVVILFLLISATLPPESLAGSRKFMDKASLLGGASEKDLQNKLLENGSKGDGLHPRFLTVKTNDYGAYDPSPTMDKPPYKLIPNSN
ncbi:hypothetical protein Cni_G06736 [Canna indica]|uniref:Uncharacterized protein n=1 Tax=Canna indica TaxID=4628 RepID=A0AAQ3JZX3_9LILI|nr:hypothetical protein Cni_G06736 [Canna indica]